jgi:predicted SAM-dependent methyltransferase
MIVSGLTLSEEEARLAAPYCEDVVVGNVEWLDLAPERHFDLILLSHVCEHLVDPVQALVKLSTHLAPGGKILIAVPNMAYYKNRFRLLKGNWQMEEAGPFDRTHLHFYSFQSVDALVDRGKLCLEKKIAGQLAIPLWPIRRLATGLSARLDQLIGSHFPNLFSQQVILVIKKVTCDE